jgi:hypothetical protein
MYFRGSSPSSFIPDTHYIDRKAFLDVVQKLTYLPPGGRQTSVSCVLSKWNYISCTRVPQFDIHMQQTVHPFTFSSTFFTFIFFFSSLFLSRVTRWVTALKQTAFWKPSGTHRPAWRYCVQTARVTAMGHVRKNSSRGGAFYIPKFRCIEVG